MTVAIILFFLFTLFISWIGKKIGDKKTSIYLLSGWLVKCFAGMLFIYAYTYYYGNGKLVEDSGAYITEAKKLADIKSKKSSDFYSILFNSENSEDLIANYFKDEPRSRISRTKTGINDTRNHIKTIAVLMLIVGQDKTAIFLIYFFLSFLGFAILWLSIKNKVGISDFWTFSLILLTPSLLFWTSSNLKEAPFMAGLCLVLAFFFSNRIKLKIWFLLIGVILLTLFKPVLLVVIFTPWLLITFIQKIVLEKKWLFGFPLIIMASLLFIFSIPKKSLKTISDQQFDFINLARGGIQVKGDTSFYFISSANEKNILIKDSIVIIEKSTPAISNLFGKIRNEQNVTLKPNSEQLELVLYQKEGGSYFEISPINNSWLSFLKAVPEAVFNSFFRPLPFDQKLSVLNLIFFLENLFFIFLIFLIFKNWKDTPKPFYSLTLTCLISVFSLAILIGITTPASGALVRYRIPIQLLIIIVYLMTKLKHERSI
jgi:hypothetical protein